MDLFGECYGGGGDFEEGELILSMLSGSRCGVMFMLTRLCRIRSGRSLETWGQEMGCDGACIAQALREEHTIEGHRL